MTTVGCTGSCSSETRACRGWDCTGSRNPACSASTLLCPAAARPTTPAPIRPRVVSTPTTRSPSLTKPVTSQCWMTSTPMASQARAKAHATWSCLAIPARGWNVPPSTGYRTSGEVLRIGQTFATSSVSSHSASTPLSRLALTRRARAGAQPLGVPAVERVGVAPPVRLTHVLQRVRQVEHPALAEEEVVVQLLGQLLPQLQRELVDPGALVPQVVGPDDGGVAG